MLSHQDQCKVVFQAASLEVSQVASQVGEDSSGNSPRYHNSHHNSQHQDGQAKEASGARLRHLSSLHLHHNLLLNLHLNLHRQGQHQLLLRLRDPQ